MMVSELPLQAAAYAIAHMNEDHGHDLLDIARHVTGYQWAESAMMTVLDSCGFDLLISGSGQNELKRIEFPAPVTDAKALRAVLVVMSQQANPELMENKMNESTELNSLARAEVNTIKASRYMKALCNHFDRKAKANYDDAKGKIEFSFGFCNLEAAADRLFITVSAQDGEQLERTKQVIGSHLVRFGEKDELHVDWLPA
ncbi:MAG: DUF2218 domain-containing protein [Anaerolineae bacterium]